MFSINVNRIRKHRNNLKSILKECRYNRNKTDCGLEDKVNSLLHKFDIKRAVVFVKLKGLNCRRFMKHHIDIINGIKDIFIEMNKGIVSDEEFGN